MENQFAKPSSLFDWLFVIFGGMWTTGVFIDGWAHIHRASTRDSFFTPWHAIFYGGMMLTATLLLLQLAHNHANGYSLRRSLPREYFFALSGVAIALVAGVGDLLWHSIFGIEIGVEALLSPTHILLAIGGAIAVSGPFHAVWYRHKDHPLHAFPTILSASYFLSVVLFMLQFLNPFNFPWATLSFFERNVSNPEYAIGVGIASIIIFTGVYMGLILSSIKHWSFPFGSFTLILGLNVFAITVTHGEYYEFIATGVIAGLVHDILYHILKPKQRGEKYIRLFSLLAPMILFGAYFITLFLTDRIIWSVHMWTGAIVLAGITGFLMSYLVISPHETTLKM